MQFDNARCTSFSVMDYGAIADGVHDDNQDGIGLVQGVSFTHTNFTDMENLIIIDQFYGNPNLTCHEKEQGVHISDVKYSNAVGTSITDVAIKLNRSSTNHCTDIKLDSIQLTSAIAGKQVVARCNAAYGVTQGIVKPTSCLKSL
ncbi:hypothetical protein Ancab_012028 [Ancistrocladus abbreviatus]